MTREAENLIKMLDSGNELDITLGLAILDQKSDNEDYNFLTDVLLGLDSWVLYANTWTKDGHPLLHHYTSKFKIVYTAHYLSDFYPTPKIKSARRYE